MRHWSRAMGMTRGAVFSLLLWAFAGDGAPAVAQESRWTNDLGMEFALIRAGSFLMGSPAGEAFRNPEEVQHEVLISRPFYMQVTEVTQGQWRAIMASEPSASKDCGGSCPVERVSWLDCQEFIQRLNKRGEGVYRLPTEAEWEYACRAGTTTSFSWGETPECDLAMFGNNKRRGVAQCVPFVRKRGLRPDSPVPVKSYPPNPWGLFDMHGNVWEWCQDGFGPYPTGKVVDPKGSESGERKVRRGGSWFKYGTFCRSANRNFAHPASRYATTGLRLVREAKITGESKAQ